MITKEMFFTLMKSLEKIDKVIYKLQDIFDFNMDDGPLVQVFDDISSLLISEMELDIDDELGPVIFHYALVNNWGENEFTLKIHDNSFKIKNLDDLYDYLSMKYIADKNDMADWEVDETNE